MSGFWYGFWYGSVGWESGLSECVAGEESLGDEERVFTREVGVGVGVGVFQVSSNMERWKMGSRWEMLVVG